MKAHKVKDIDSMRGEAALYQLDPGGVLPEYVVVSAVNVPFSGPETYIFAANADGAIVDWTELPGSFRGALDHARALHDAGYQIVEVVES